MPTDHLTVTGKPLRVALVCMNPDHAKALDAVLACAERCDRDLRATGRVSDATATNLRRALDRVSLYRNQESHHVR